MPLTREQFITAIHQAALINELSADIETEATGRQLGQAVIGARQAESVDGPVDIDRSMPWIYISARALGQWRVERHTGNSSTQADSFEVTEGTSALELPVIAHSAAKTIAETPASDGPVVFTAENTHDTNGFIAMLRQYADNFLEPRHLTTAATEYRAIAQELDDTDTPTEYAEIRDFAEEHLTHGVIQHGYKLHTDDNGTVTITDPTAGLTVGAQSALIGARVNQTGPTVTAREKPTIDAQPLKHGQTSNYPVRHAPSLSATPHFPRGMYGQTPTPTNRPTL